MCLAALALGACSGDDEGTSGTTAGEETSEPTTTLVAPADVSVAGPITGGARRVPYNPMPLGLADEYGYTEEEYFVSGDAASYVPAGELAPDGQWTVTEGESAPYETRILVRRPIDPEDFNGTVVVEWLNVSAGRDSDPVFGYLHPYLLREGYAYVGVSAQATGIEGGGARLEVPGVPPDALAPLREWDPERYGSLTHPGDAWSYGIYTDVAEMVRAPGEPNPLEGLAVDHVLAVGESQSAARLASYVNAVQPVEDAFDGIFVHSRGAGGADLGEDPAAAAPSPLRLRTDLDVPVMQFEAETDLMFLRFREARQPDAEQLLTWEVAGTAHADADTLVYGTESGQAWNSGGGLDSEALCGTINDGPHGAVLRAAMHAFRAWVVDGTRPPSSPRIEIADDQIVRDDLGNARGGIRTPAVDVPVSALSGEGNPSSVFCSLFGQSAPFSDEQLRSLYGDHATYVERFTAAADEALEAGFLLEPERDEMVAEAEARDVAR
nr:alpha/beta hydrolase domain-containing protein [Rhabdothermincola salaria]